MSEKYFRVTYTVSLNMTQADVAKLVGPGKVTADDVENALWDEMEAGKDIDDILSVGVLVDEEVSVRAR